MTPIVNPIPADLTLTKGSHTTPDNGMCLLEAAAYISGEPHSDHPACVSPVIATFGRKWNDDLPDDDRQRLLLPLLPLLPDTASTEEVEEARAWMVTDWMVRECAPAWLRLAGLVEQADELESLAPVVSPETANAGQAAIRRARMDASTAAAAAVSASWSGSWSGSRDVALSAAGVASVAAASAAAEAAAWSAEEAAASDASGASAVAAAWYAAGAAACDVALEATRAASWTASWTAARDGARRSAWAAARDALAPTVTALQESAVALVKRMCALTPDDVIREAA